jgi:hypothetical protein
MMQLQPARYRQLRLVQVIGLLTLAACGPTITSTAPSGKSQATLDAEKKICLDKSPITDTSMTTYAQCMRDFGNTVTVSSSLEPSPQVEEINRAEQNAPLIYGREPTPQERSIILSACKNWANQQFDMQLRALGSMIASYWSQNAGPMRVSQTKDQFMADCWHKHVVL